MALRQAANTAASESESTASTGVAPRPAAKVNMAINKEIMACKGVQDLCSVIQNRVIEFNHVNLAAAFRKLLPTPRHGAARGTVDQSVQALEVGPAQHRGLWTTGTCQHPARHGQGTLHSHQPTSS
jgi:hypothetical protein